MNIIMKQKSQFDTGNWSEVNGLPGQQDMLNFLSYLTSTNPDRCFTRRQLMDEVAKEFDIPAMAQEAEGPKSHIAGYYTRLTYLISDAIQGVRRANGNPFLKRIAFSVYQHINGNGVVDLAMREFLRKRALNTVSRRHVEDARISVRILRHLNPPMDPETILCELGGRAWSDEEIETAIRMEFPNV